MSEITQFQRHHRSVLVFYTHLLWCTTASHKYLSLNNTLYIVLFQVVLLIRKQMVFY